MIGALLPVTVLGWIPVPGVGLADTGLAGAPGARIYLAVAALSLLGGLSYALGLLVASSATLLVGLALTGVG
ncbi:hypothetical protein [Natronorarus salvus]|uniref:hypothetical protein n=1 Tax=Natronorarus salvus TaxID=3117733 RepID=UPI002F26532F